VVQFSAAWVRRKRFEAGLLAQALSFAGPAPAAKPAGRDDFWNMLTAAAGEVVNVEQDGDKAG